MVLIRLAFGFWWWLSLFVEEDETAEGMSIVVGVEVEEEGEAMEELEVTSGIEVFANGILDLCFETAILVLVLFFFL